MAVTEFLVRDCVPQVNQGDDDTPDWLSIAAHLTDWSGSGTVNNADTTTFEDVGWTSQLAASRGMTFTLNGKSQEDPDTGDRDAGQVYCEAWARLRGASSRKGFRVLTPANEVLFEMKATANLATPGGGGSDDASNWGLELTSSGPVTTPDQPTELAAPTGADAVTGDDSITGTWTPPAGTVDWYEVEVYRDSDDTVVATEKVTSAAILVTGLVTATAYYFRVRAQNGAGYSPWSAVSDTVTTS